MRFCALYFPSSPVVVCVSVFLDLSLSGIVVFKGFGFVEMCFCMSVSAMEVNGCRQHESLIKTSQHSSPSVNIWRRQKC